MLLGTRQATTAALLIGTLRVERVAFLLTDATPDLPGGLLYRASLKQLCGRYIAYRLDRIVAGSVRRLLNQR